MTKAVKRDFCAVLLVCAFAPFSLKAAKEGPGPDAATIVQRSIAVNTADWKAQPQYSHEEHNTKTKIDSGGDAKSTISKRYEVTMIEGSPYSRLIGIDNEPLTAAQAQQERDKLNREIRRRRNESPVQRSARIAKYQGDRSEEHLLMQQMVDAFHFRLNREEQIDGIDCYLLDAIPNPDYSPPVEKARVLLGMKGHLWIDKAEYHWVKVQAEVIKPVQFGLFIAQVKPGTKFELEQAPVGGVWLPKRFMESVNASIFGFYGMRSRQEEHYSNYELIADRTAGHPPSHTVAAAEAALNGSGHGGSREH